MKFPLKPLCLAIAIINAQLAFALESLDDEAMSQTTGEGVALLPENYSFMMNGENPLAATAGDYSDNGGRGTYGTGYMRFIPVGPLTATATGKGYQKADIWLYGLSLGQSKKDYGADINSTDWGVPFGAIGTGASDFGRTINTWGTANNPWILKTVTDNNVPDFVGGSGTVAYLGLEAPLYHASANPLVNPISSLSLAEQSAYNLKLGYWMDMAMRDPTVAESGYNGLSHRLRLAFAWNGFSLNGSNFKLFQTLGGATAGGTYNATLKITSTSNSTVNSPFTPIVTNTNFTFNKGLSTSYNQTLGMAGVVRLNSRPTDSVRATIGSGSITREIIQLDYQPVRNYNSTTETYAGQYVEGTVLATNTVATGIGTMSSVTAEATNSNTGLDVSYEPMTNSSKRGPTTDPDGGGAVSPSYKPSYYYRVSGTVTQGSFYDGGVCTSATTGNRTDNHQFGQCLTMEGFTTRRFKARTTNSWTPPAAKSVLRLSTQELSSGIFGAGTPALRGGSGLSNVPNFAPNAATEGIFIYDMNVNMVLGSLYQPLILNTNGSNFSFELTRIPNVQSVYKKIYTRYEAIDPAASVDVGVNYEGSTCNIYQCGTHPSGTNATISSTYQAATATHSSITIGSTVYNAATNQLQAHKGSDSYGVSFGEAVAQTGLATQTYVDYAQVWDRTRNARTGTSIGCWFQPCYDGFRAWGDTTYDDTAYSGVAVHDWAKVAAKAAVTGQPHSSLNRANPYETSFRQNYNNQLLGIQTTMPVGSMANTINNLTPAGASATNNFGSAVIDGLLIQHLKFSTTGL